LDQNLSSGYWKLDDDLKAVRLEIASTDNTIMELDSSAGDGESKSTAPSTGAPSIIDAVKGIEELR
jgi:hypothetical protein